MTWLALLLLFKTVATLLFVAMPLLLFPRAKLDRMMDLTSQTTTIYRLYGVAMLALLVAYGFGAVDSLSGRLPWNVVAMGLISNAGAVLVMALTGTLARQRVMAGFLSVVSIGLILTAIAPDLALQTAF